MFENIDLKKAIGLKFIGFEDYKDGVVLAFEPDKFVYLEACANGDGEEPYIVENKGCNIYEFNVTKLTSMFGKTSKVIEEYKNTRKERMAQYLKLKKELGL